MKPNQLSEDDLIKQGYEYLSEYGTPTKEHLSNQLWRLNDDLVVYDPEALRIIATYPQEKKQPRYQKNYFNEKTSDLHVGERRHK